MILVTGALDARPETFDDLRRLCVAHSARSRGEPGCLSHNVHVDCEAPLRLVFVERWAGLDALRAHFADADAIGFVKAARKLAAGGSRMEVLDATPAKV